MQFGKKLQKIFIPPSLLVSIYHNVVGYNMLVASAWQDGSEGRGNQEEKFINTLLTHPW